MIKGNSQVLKRRKRTSKREKGRSPNLLKESFIFNVMDMAISKRNVLVILDRRATTLSDSDSSTSDSEDRCDEEGNFSAFMSIAHVKSSKDLNLLVQELGKHSDEEFGNCRRIRS